MQKQQDVCACVLHPPLQVAITLALTRVLGKLFAYLKQPQVIGEIVAGIFLGPSVLGRIPGEA
jgi:Kef-type K+ transport system membrane component KefB